MTEHEDTSADATRWHPHEIPLDWQQTELDVLTATLRDKDRGSGFSLQVQARKTAYALAGENRVARNLWLRERLAAGRADLARTMGRIREQRPITFDHACAQRALGELMEYWPHDEPKPELPLLHHRIALAIAQTRGELNLDITKAPPIEDMSDEQERRLRPALQAPPQAGPAEADPEAGRVGALQGA